MGKILAPMFLALVLGAVIASVGTASLTPSINQANSTTMVYLDPPTIDGMVEGEEFNVNIMVRGAPDMQGWQLGMTFNAILLNCTGFFEGEFLSDVGPTQLVKKGAINNTAGVITMYAYTFAVAETYASGDGRLAYATFKVKASGVSDLHFRDVKLSKWIYVDGDAEKVPIPTNIIDVYTVVVDTTRHTVVTVSNSTDRIEEIMVVDTKVVTIVYSSGFSEHASNLTLREISFKVSGPHPGFSNVTIPKALLPPPVSPHVWAVITNGTARIIEAPTENATHTFLYFTYPKHLNNIQVTTRLLPSTISIALSEDSIPLEESVTISGNITAADNTIRPNADLTIKYRTKGDEEWDTLATVETNSDGIYSHDWTPETKGTYELMASWEGDLETIRAESDVKSLKVGEAPGIPMTLIAVAVAVILIIVAIVVYFVKFRKS